MEVTKLTLYNSCDIINLRNNSDRKSVIMSKFTDYIGSQFGNPRGIIGKICCIIMNIINNEKHPA